MSCSRKQHSDASEARTRSPSVSIRQVVGIPRGSAVQMLVLRKTYKNYASEYAGPGYVTITEHNINTLHHEEITLEHRQTKTEVRKNLQPQHGDQESFVRGGQTLMGFFYS